MATTSVQKLTSAETRRAIPGTVVNVILTGAATNNHVFIAEIQSVPGSEPPRQVHTREDETAIIKEGALTYFIGDDIINAAAGDTVLLPKNIPHHFVITSQKATLILVTTPAHFGDFFCQLSMPYSGNDIPAPQRPSEEKVKQIEALMADF